MLAFFVSCVPPRTSHHHKRIVRMGQFSRLADRPELVDAKATLDALLLPHQPATPIEGPVQLEVAYTWPWLAKHGKTIRRFGRIPHTSKPDLTNVTKTLEDRLVRLRFIEDDRAVVTLTARKWWGDHPGISVCITPATAVSIDRKECA